MAAKYPITLPPIQQPQTGFPIENIPNEQMPVVTTPVDLGTAAQDPEIKVSQNPGTTTSPLDLSAQDTATQVQLGNTAVSSNTTAGQGGGALSDLWNFLQNTIIGNIILVAVAAAIIITLVVKIHDWMTEGSTLQAKIQNASGGLSPSQALAARQSLDQYISSTSGLLSAAGIAPAETTTISNITNLTEGSEIAASVRQYAVAHASPGTAAVGPFVVVGAAGPTHYTSLNQLNMNRYLDTLSQNQTPSTIVENSAALHGLNTPNVEK